MVVSCCCDIRPSILSICPLFRDWYLKHCPWHFPQARWMPQVQVMMIRQYWLNYWGGIWCDHVKISYPDHSRPCWLSSVTLFGVIRGSIQPQLQIRDLYHIKISLIILILGAHIPRNLGTLMTIYNWINFSDKLPLSAYFSVRWVICPHFSLYNFV